MSTSGQQLANSVHGDIPRQAVQPKIAATLQGAGGGALPEHVLARLDEANDNLEPFIDYKRPQFA
jgi:hypothetical protein